MLTISKILPCNNNSMYFEFTIDTNNDLPKNGIVTLENKIYVIADNSIAVNRTTNQYLKFTNGKWVKTLKSVDTNVITNNIIKENGDYILPSNNIMGVTSAVVDVNSGTDTSEASYVISYGEIIPYTFTKAFSTLQETVNYLNNSLFTTQFVTLNICSNVTEIPDYAFSGAKYITYINCSTSLKHIGNYAFANCLQLQDFSIGPNLESMGENVFAGCTQLETIEVYSTNNDIIAGAPWGAPNAETVFPK